LQIQELKDILFMEQRKILHDLSDCDLDSGPGGTHFRSCRGNPAVGFGGAVAPRDRRMD
jgi:hypothetical protein